MGKRADVGGFPGYPPVSVRGTLEGMIRKLSALLIAAAIVLLVLVEPAMTAP